MTLSFTAHWHDELPGFYTALKPTPLQNSRLIWHNDRLAEELAIPPELFQRSGSLGRRNASRRYATPCSGL